uniref:NAD-dependent epimerase/dehydratase domain-containing protein n=1 Tax=Parascaris univalens TaxID=6257 RepID=A0A914ZPE2_PARUN
MPEDEYSAETKFRVLVTGASGYIALHCVQQLLEMGYTVRGTVRNLRNSAKIAPLRDLACSSERLELVEADLQCREHWPSAIEGCDYILHVASPWPIVADENTITVAVEGTENVLKVAATVPTVKKVVLTSSCAAINDGHKNQSRVFNEECWTDLESTKIENYARSKTLAERAAWHFWNNLQFTTRFQLTVINPTFVVGPVLSDQSHGSATVIARLMNIRTCPAMPKVCLGMVDVRDVAHAHIVAMTAPETDGERILVTATPSVWFADIAQWLNKEFKNQGYKISRVVVPNWLLRLYSKTKVDPQIGALIYRTGPELRFDNSKSKKLLKMEYRSPQQSILDMVYSMIDQGMIKKTHKYKPQLHDQKPNDPTTA